jgi:HEAT repeat protein
MQLPVGKIVRLIEAENAPEVRRAAVTVLGEVGGRDAEVSAALMDALTDDDPEVRLRAIRAAGQLKVERSIPQLAERIKTGGAEAELAADAAAHLGAKGSAALRDLMPKVAPGLRRYIAAALARTAADVSDLDVLVDKDPSVVEAAVNSLAVLIPQMEPKRRKSLAHSLMKMAANKKSKLPPAAEAGVIRLAGMLDDNRLADLLWDRILPPHPPEVRGQALQALGRWANSPSREQRHRLFRCAADPSFRVAAPALMILDKLPPSPKTASEWEPLLRAPDIAVRRVAMAKIGDRDTKDIIDALLEQVRHPDRGYREQVLARLGKSVRGRTALVKLLREAETPDDAWNLTRTLAPLAQADPASWADDLFPAAIAYVEAGDRRADPLLFVLRESGHAGLRERLEKRAASLVKKKDFETANLVYRVLARDPAVGLPVRLHIAACGLMVSNKELESEFRANDPALHQLADLARIDADGVLAYLSKTSWLRAEELYYVGFHFSEYVPPLKEFGADVLRSLLKRFPRSKLAAAAKNKLKTVG